MTTTTDSSDERTGDGTSERVAPARLLPLAVQHVLAMIATPISAAFMISAGLGLSTARTASLLSATLVLCGVGALLQSFTVLRIGAKLPFLMLPGGAALAIFLQIAKDHGAATASGSVLLAALFLLLVLPAYRWIAPFFPPLVLGVSVLVIGVNMLKVTGGLVTGQSTSPDYAKPSATALAWITVGCTALFFLLLRGVWRQMSVLLGLVAGCAIAALTGLGTFHKAAGGTVVATPHPFPYGTPHLDLVAALPLLIFALASLAEATGQTVLNSEAVGRAPDPGRDVPRVARADAVVSLLGGAFGTTLLVTSSENIGIVQLTGVRSRFVTAAAGVLLILAGLFAPVSRLLAALPAPVVGGAALVIYAVIAVMGVQMLGRVDLSGQTNKIVLALALTAGLLPVVTPDLHQGLPQWGRTVFGTGVTAAVIAAVVLHAVFSRVTAHRDRAAPT
ncbi:uracil-xanthine permease family protein [Actinomadura atramentaria]|uniref:uracil-xanthine permease family protein n=1 Tax=Actinomadura atramentaria TaxID=1990 RepID=UPI0003793860|nr:solute carrier family 23 protein [Actinomadura atramentaria]